MNYLEIDIHTAYLFNTDLKVLFMGGTSNKEATYNKVTVLLAYGLLLIDTHGLA